MLRKKCSKRINHRKHPKTKLEGCSLYNFTKPNIYFAAALRDQTEQK
jgi:hypothetical protein